MFSFSTHKDVKFICSNNFGKIMSIISSLENSTLRYEEQNHIISMLESDCVNECDIERLEQYIFRNKIDKINAGRKYTQTDILRKLRNEI